MRVERRTARSTAYGWARSNRSETEHSVHIKNSTQNALAHELRVNQDRTTRNTKQEFQKTFYFFDYETTATSWGAVPPLRYECRVGGETPK